MKKSAVVVVPREGGPYDCCFIVVNASFSRRLIAFSACLCPAAVLGCAAMISWTLAARLIPIHP